MNTVAPVLVLALWIAPPAFAEEAAASAPIDQEQLAVNLHDTRAAAEQGDAGAQFRLGTMYRDGRGVARDDAQAVMWYRKAADQGNAAAQEALRRMEGSAPATTPSASGAPSVGGVFPPVNGSAPTASIGAPPTASFPGNSAAPFGGAGGGFGAPPPQAGGPSEDCMKGFLPLREEAEKRGKAIKAAGDRHASPEEACKLVGNFSQAELKMIKYVEKNAAKCGIPQQVADQLKAGHKNTDAMQTKVCNVAQQMQRGSASSLREMLRREMPMVGDFDPETIRGPASGLR